MSETGAERIEGNKYSSDRSEIQRSGADVISIAKNTAEKKTNEYEVIRMPHVLDEPKTALPDTERDNIDSLRLDSYMKFLEEYMKLPFESTHVAPYEQSLFKDITEMYESYKQRIEEFSSSQKAEQNLSTKLGEKNKILMEDKETTPDVILESLKEDFREEEGTKVCLADSHLHSAYTIESAFEESAEENPNIAVMVFDNHVDVYQHGTAEEWKGNIFYTLVRDNYIKKALFIGAPDHSNSIKDAEDGLFLHKMGALNGKFERIEDSNAFEQIDVQKINEGKNINRVELVKALQEKIIEYKEAGITNVVFSVDIDVLRAKELGYTAMEYNPMHLLTYIASLDIPIDKEPSQLSEDELRSITWQLFGEKNNQGRRNPLESNSAYDPEGIRLGDIGISIDCIVEECRKQGIEVGIDLKGGGKYVGDVVEVGGYDYRGRTAKAATALIDRLARTADLSQKDQEDLTKVA